ncbi:deoxyribonuclease 1 like 4, tandem duplicate 1 isoform X2 [Callorhinchus milii]|uniref:Deoxyribonuclease 1 like 4, tandem duplicate 1 n=1 Tax=Callorhinchus milii TaxID=7868 RepID=A0A4W3JV63_CALMI|nr:deoxyribonuclease 1 like 4, tandem duplicate 1 isoform X2 [Callorhinchus milii]
MKIAAFNIQRFGTNKISKPKVLSTIINIVMRYDIILIMEVTDRTGEAVEILNQELNKNSKDHHYSSVLSKPLGRGSYKEQYLFLYRDTVVQVKRLLQYDDLQPGDEDAFSREPFIVEFTSPASGMEDFVLIPQHTTPNDSVKEIDELYDVVLKVKSDWNTENIMILGDFNADGRYVSKRKMKTIRLRTDPNFHWLIGDDEDTTANPNTDQAYDRFWMSAIITPLRWNSNGQNKRKICIWN